MPDRDPNDPSEPKDSGRDDGGGPRTNVGIIDDPPYGQVQAAQLSLQQAKSESTAGLVTGIAGLIVAVLGCWREFQVFVCLGSSAVIVSMVLVFLARQNIAQAQELLSEATAVIRRALVAATKTVG